MTDDNRASSQDSGQEVQIPSGEWESFLNGFSLKHDRWIATVEVIGASGEREVEIRERPFSGASYDEPGTGETRIIIGLSDEDPANHLAHSVINPTSVSLVGNNADDIKVKAADGSITIVRFVKAVDPGKPSGIAA
jgi:hypothetical protein